MKKVHVLVEAKDVVPALEELRSLGLLHIEHFSEPKSGRLSEVKEHFLEVEKALALIEKCPDLPSSDKKQSRGLVIAKEMLALSVEAEHLKERILKTTTVLERWAVWGNFEPKDMAALRDKGFYAAFFEGNEKDLQELPVDVTVEEVSRSGNVIRALVFSRKALSFPSLTYDVPSQSKSAMEQLLREDNEAVRVLEKKITGYAAQRVPLEHALSELANARAFEETAEGMMKESQISVVKGFCPEEVIPSLEAGAKAHSWGLLVEDPVEEDKVPTLLKNPEWIRVITPLFEFMNIIPGYKEADVSLCFLVFFSLFFGILIGDAGYGFLFLAITFLIQRKMPQGTDPSAFRLMYILSGCAILWGMATGVFFGVSLFGQWVKPMVPWLTDSKNVQLLCFMIGVTHLTIAHIWRGLRKLPSWAAFSDIGWIALLWSAYFLCGQIILDRAIPVFVMPMLWTGVGIVVLFSQPNKNIFKAAGMGTSDLLLGIMSVFIDLVSYIRLFAVGAASLALAESFNVAVTSLGFGSVLAGLGTAFILVLGHTLNIVLCLMAVLVHGLRLNILEFSGHQGIEWAGMKYEPFRKAGSLE